MNRRTRIGSAALIVLAAAATCAAVAVTGSFSGSSSAAAAAPGSASSAGTSGRAGSPARLKVTGGYMPQPLLTDMAAAYFTVTNTGGSAARLTSVTSPLAAHATLHTTSNDTMEQVQSLTVPAGGALTLSTGGNHVMLEDLTHKPAVGATVSLTLHFAQATPATVTITVPVRPTSYTPGG